jgi:hypothetical protein
MNKVGCCRTTAIKRIRKCKTVDELFTRMENGKRDFIIENTKVKVEDVMEKIGCCKNTAYARLNSSSTLERLYRPLAKYNDDVPSGIINKDLEINKLLYGKW